MKNIFNPTYRQEYIKGFSNGLDPNREVTYHENSEAFNTGFNFGRLDYERMNGLIADGIPQRIVTNKVLEDFLLAGLLGMRISAECYTPYQINVLAKWYQSGIEKYDPKDSIYLAEILEENGIEIN